MKTKPQHLQESLLNALCRERVPVSLYLGIELQHQIESFGPSVVLLKNALTQMVCKHANSTVVPARAGQYFFRRRGDASMSRGRRPHARGRALV